MKAYRSFTVRPSLPEALRQLQPLAMNLRWAWDERTQDLFRWVDSTTWEATGQDPVRLLGQVGRHRLEELAADRAFVSFLREVHADLRRDLEADRWFQGRQTSLRSVAYFSPEFGIAKALPQYSGGLGVLAGDHLKAASALGVPLVGVGLFYAHGYFRQELNGDGWQEERYVTLDPHAMPLTALDVDPIDVDLAGSTLLARIWRADVGRIPLYLLDTSVEENDEGKRAITDRLYGGDTEHRLQQEILLGIGGVKALEAVGAFPQVFHSNEGHAGFLGLERIRRCMRDDDLSFDEAIESIRASTVFTTHTPVPAGIDRFPRPLMERYFKRWVDECGVPFERLMALGHEPGEPSDAPFNMAVMGLRLAAFSNGVSKLHGEVSRHIFRCVWPDVPVEELPVGSITNGIHARTWVSAEVQAIFDRHVLPEWHVATPDRWARIDAASDDELWRARQQGKERLIAFVRQRLRASALSRGMTEGEFAWVDDAFDPAYLTVGFARRFAPYKRATLLLSDPERLARLLSSSDQPMQLLFAGKAHPADDPGKEMIRQVVQFSRRQDVRHRVAFLEDYDIGVARMLYQGCDVWLNTPRRPLEACGTSGEKAGLNGALNLSILDGWWDELYDGTNGWAVPSFETYADLHRRDELEAGSLFDILERQVVPLYYDARPARPPVRWLSRVRRSLRTLGPVVTASRMVRDYVEVMYEKAAAHGDALTEGGHARARALTEWKHRVSTLWDSVTVETFDHDTTAAALGMAHDVIAVVGVGKLGLDDIRVELIHGPVGPGDEIVDTTIVPMALAGLDETPGAYRYQGSFTIEHPGRYGFTVRAVPSHPDLLSWVEVGKMTLA